MNRVNLDLNNPTFLRSLFALQKADKLRVLDSLERISRLTWPELYQDRGLRWEAITSKKGREGEQVHSFRVTLKIRAVAQRKGDFLVMNSVHADHDSAYQ